MKRVLVFASGLFLLTSCASKETTVEAQKKLDENWSPKVGVATKNELVEQFGNPEWCKQNESGTGEETCRFYRKKGTKWIGDKATKRDKKPVEQFDQVVADFNADGVLKNIKTTAQR